MCFGCYEERGKPAIVNEKTRAVAALVDRIYDLHLAGGLAHIVVDDWNLEDGNIQWCLDYTEANKDREPADLVEACRAALEALLAMTDDERASAMAIHEGWIGVVPR